MNISDAAHIFFLLRGATTVTPAISEDHRLITQPQLTPNSKVSPLRPIWLMFSFAGN